MNMSEEKIIYTRMLEGTTNFVPCIAEFLSENIYLITENREIDLLDDATQIWEFFPGDTVKCAYLTQSVHSFGGGVLIPVDPDESSDSVEENILVAKELIESTFPNRKLYQLIFDIVINKGKIEKSKYIEFEREINQICFDKSVFQRNHPIINSWIQENCRKENP